jgi:hypothetical protein
MPYTITDTRKTGGTTALQDFLIQDGAELGNCHGAQSFRAIRRLGGETVLLHKFRPAESLLALGPIVANREAPDFTRPFVTRFTDLFMAAGSAYLVEPVPPCSGLSTVWRYVLQKRAYQAVPVMTVLIWHMLRILQRPAGRRTDRGMLDFQNIVLASTGSFGVLTAHLTCKRGLLWLRKDADRPGQSDFHSLVEILAMLLDIDTEVAALRRTPTRLSPDFHRKIARLLHAARQGTHRPRVSVRS